MSRINQIFDEVSQKLEPLRRWVDGPDPRDLKNEVEKFEKRSSRSEEFMLSVAREIDRVLKDEFVSNRIRGTAYVPDQFVVFLNTSDDRMWSGEKRKFLAQTLADIIFQEAKKLCGENLKLTTNAIAVEVKADATLGEGELYVRALSNGGAEQTVFSQRARETQSDKKDDPDVPTVFDPSGGIRTAQPLYFLELSRSKQRTEKVPIYKREITIGRGSQNTPSDLELEADPRVSRIHAALRLDEKGKLWLTAKGTNPTILAGRLLARGETARVEANQKIEIYDFTLRYKPKDIRKKRAKFRN